MELSLPQLGLSLAAGSLTTLSPNAIKLSGLAYNQTQLIVI